MAKTTAIIVMMGPALATRPLPMSERESRARRWRQSISVGRICVGAEFGLGSGQCEKEGRARAWLGAQPDCAAVVFDDLAADGEPDTCSWVRIFRMQSLEDDKDIVGESGVNAYAVVLYGKLP
jgi:hypothetical protein